MRLYPGRIYGAALVVSEVDTFEGRDVASLTFAHARQVLDIVAPPRGAAMSRRPARGRRPQVATRNSVCPRCSTPIKPGDLIQHRPGLARSYDAIHANCDEETQ